MGPSPSPDRLVAIIELQNELVAASLELDGAIARIREAALELTGAAAVVDDHGVLDLPGEPPESFTEQDLATLELLSGVIVAHMARAGEGDALEHQRQYDARTGLRNRRAFDERLESELFRARRHGGQFALCLLDLEPASGAGRDSVAVDVLQGVASHLSLVRGEDAAYRLEGDEFALVLVEVSSYGADTAIERVSAAMAEDPLCQSVNASWGVATFQRGDDAASILARADAALYLAKAAVTEPS